MGSLHPNSPVKGVGRMTRRRLTTAVTLLLTLLTVLALADAPASAQAAASPCPPGQPNGRPPGVPPNEPGPPNGRPPSYPPGRCALALSRSAAERGQTFTATGEGFAPGETVTFSIGNQRVAEAIADANGRASATLTVPNDAPIGATNVRAVSATQELTASFEVLPTAAQQASRSASTARAGAGALSRTGQDTAQLATLGLGLVMLGTVIVIVVRRRRNMATDAA